MKTSWAAMADDLFDPIREVAETVLQTRSDQLFSGRAQTEVSHPQAACLALYHFLQCLQTSQFANVKEFYSVAMGLLRQCVESLSIVELGLVNEPQAVRIQKLWEDGKQVGEVRRWLEVNVWPRYGSGLWNEPWREYFWESCKGSPALCALLSAVNGVAVFGRIWLNGGTTRGTNEVNCWCRLPRPRQGFENKSLPGTTRMDSRSDFDR